MNKMYKKLKVLVKQLFYIFFCIFICCCQLSGESYALKLEFCSGGLRYCLIIYYPVLKCIKIDFETFSSDFGPLCAATMI